jgi:hypothetical protein
MKVLTNFPRDEAKKILEGRISEEYTLITIGPDVLFDVQFPDILDKTADILTSLEVGPNDLVLLNLEGGDECLFLLALAGFGCIAPIMTKDFAVYSNINCFSFGLRLVLLNALLKSLDPMIKSHLKALQECKDRRGELAKEGLKFTLDLLTKLDLTAIESIQKLQAHVVDACTEFLDK